MKTFLISLIILLFISGCGYKEGVVTGDQKAYLFFTGSVDGVKASVDNGPSFAIKAGRDNLYKVAPGKHNVKVMKADAVIVERDVYVGDGVSKEINVGSH